jgi:putative transposase
MNWKQLLASNTGSVDKELRLRHAYLTTENRILRNQIKGRVPLTDAERKTLAEMGQKLGKKALEEVATIAQPETILAWHRTLMAQKFDGSQHRKFPGRPKVDSELEALVVRMAQENRRWGYDRMVGAVANLDYRISDQTVGNILKRHDIPPAPERTKTLTWREFIRMHMAVVGDTEFFSSAVWSWLRRLVSSVLSFLHVGLCKGDVAGMTFLCHRGWIWPSCGPPMSRETRRGGYGSSGRQHHHGGFRVANGSYTLSSARLKPLMTEPPFRKAWVGRCSCLRPIAIRYGMAPFEVDNGSAGC